MGDMRSRAARGPRPGRGGHIGVLTAIGPVVISWRDSLGRPLVDRIYLPAEIPAELRRRPEASCREIDRLAIRLVAFCAGEPVDLDRAILDLDACPDFQRSVLVAEHEIPRGWVSTYGLVARHVGHPGAARAVGTALGRNPFPLVIPCHRAVREGGALGGYRGGLPLKRRLLEQEGVLFDGRGRVVMNRVSYR